MLNGLAKAPMGSRTPRRVHVRMYLWWYSFTLAEWIHFCLSAYVGCMDGGGFTLPTERGIKTYPSHAVFTAVRGGRDVMPRDGYRTAEPMDWDEDVFIEELAALGVFICRDCVVDGMPVRLNMQDCGNGHAYATCPNCEEEYVSNGSEPAELAI